ncbi:MAG: DNA-formamidopyrimidine glycosylase [Patescibacteria group bacterium]
MPELPEVQTIVEDLKKKVVGRIITGVWFDAPKIITLRLAQGDGERSRTIKKPKATEFQKQIKGLKITDIQRRGKNILIYLVKSYKLKAKSCYLLLIHQKMTGHLLVGKWQMVNGKVESLIKGLLREKVNNYIHLIFYLDNGWQLALSDLRKFAKVLFGLKEEIENLPDLKMLGPEPLDESFKIDKFISLISLEKRKIKQVLMDQEVISGIGNIYSDEILWQAKIHPFTPANRLKTGQLKTIYSSMRQILKKAIKLRGTSISDFRDTSGKSGAYADIRKVYAKEGEKCQRCQTLIKRIKIGGRSAHFCPKCQII